MIERFSSKTKQAASGCVEWTGARDAKGYGHFSVDGSARLAHRVAWELDRGPIPPGMLVLHGCDNTSCVFIEHLHLGTHMENMAEASERGRWEKNAKRGSDHPMSTLTEKIVLEMRERYASGFFYISDIAARFNVSRPQTRKILARQAWGHI